MKMINAASRAISVTALLASLSVQATTITIVNADGPGEGFNDPTPVAPVGGNPGTTLGEQRLHVFQYAAAQWAARIDSDVEIRVESNFDPLSCNAYSAVLGAAGTTSVHRDFSGAPLPATWYPQALANALAGVDLSANPDIGATFNSAIDNNNSCLIGTNWYLGLDGNNQGDIDLADVVMHEIGHGLGFASYVDESTGQYFFNYPDVYSSHLEDHSTGLSWLEMSNIQRQASAVDTGDLHFVGSNLVAAAGHVSMYAPNPVEPGSSVSHFDTSLSPNELMEPFITSPPLHDLGLAYPLLLDLGWSPTNQSGNTPPEVTISAPVTGAVYTPGEEITLQAAATDNEDGDLGALVSWTSDLDGDLGTGSSLTVNWLQEGDHLIIASVTDTQGITTMDQVGISVVSVTGLPPAAPSNVTVTDPGNGTALVSWADNSDSEDRFDIVRESPHKKRPGVWTGSTIVATVPADTVSYTDASGTGTFRYCVNAANTSGSSDFVCSDAVEITDTSGGGGDTSGSTFCDTHPTNKRCQ